MWRQIQMRLPIRRQIFIVVTLAKIRRHIGKSYSLPMWRQIFYQCDEELKIVTLEVPKNTFFFNFEQELLAGEGTKMTFDKTKRTVF